MDLRISSAGEFCLFSRGPFFTFRPIFAHFGRFWWISGAIFPFFDVFSVFGDGILARRMRPCTIGHPEMVLKRANWAPKVSLVQTVDLGARTLGFLGPNRL